MSGTVIAIVVVSIVVLAIAAIVVYMIASAPKTGAGEACEADSECEGHEEGAKCLGKKCTNTTGKFEKGGPCAILAGQRTSACPDGFYCGREPAVCNPIGTKSDGSPDSLCAADLADLSCGYEDGTQEIGADGKPVPNTGVKLKCDGFGYCQRPKNAIDVGGTCKSSLECKAGDGGAKTCCSDGKCTLMVKKGEVWWCPGDPLDAAATTVANIVSGVADDIAGVLKEKEVKVGERCGIGLGTCAPGSRCCVEPASNLTTCQVPLQRRGSTDAANLVCPKDPLLRVPLPQTLDVGERCDIDGKAYPDACKGAGIGGKVACCNGTCKTLTPGFLGILGCPV